MSIFFKCSKVAQSDIHDILNDIVIDNISLESTLFFVQYKSDHRREVCNGQLIILPEIEVKHVTKKHTMAFQNFFTLEEAGECRAAMKKHILSSDEICKKLNIDKDIVEANKANFFWIFMNSIIDIIQDEQFRLKTKLSQNIVNIITTTIKEKHKNESKKSKNNNDTYDYKKVDSNFFEEEIKPIKQKYENNSLVLAQIGYFINLISKNYITSRAKLEKILSDESIRSLEEQNNIYRLTKIHKDFKREIGQGESLEEDINKEFKKLKSCTANQKKTDKTQRRNSSALLMFLILIFLVSSILYFKVKVSIKRAKF